MAGTVAVSLHDHFVRSRWIESVRQGNAYRITADGTRAFAGLGLDVDRAHALRRRFAYACLDWSERRPHLGGALGAALLSHALARKWLAREYDSRALLVTRLGQREFRARFGLDLSAAA
jgi:hypothetical protein